MPEKRRLLLVSHEMTLSGAPIQLAHLVRWLQQRGWATTVVAPEPGPLTDSLPGVELLYDPQLLVDPYYGTLRRLAPQYDLVLANTIATWQAVQACHHEQVPVLWYLHETQVGVQLMALVHMIEPSLALADAVVTPTQRTAAVYAPHHAQRIDVIPYGIPAVEPLPLSTRSQLHFAVIGTFEYRKGQDVLLEAIGRLPAGVRERVRFQLAGRDLEPEFTAALREKSNSLGNVSLLGALDHHEALRLLTQADVLVLPSRDETMPLVLLEALSLGKPVICTAVGGIEEWMQNGVNGLVVPPENAAALALALEQVANDAELRGRIAIAGRDTFDHHFTIDRFGEQFAEIIREVIARAPAAAT